MPRRTITVSHLYVHERRRTGKRKDVANFDGHGSDLLVLLRAFVVGLPKDRLVDREKERYLSTINLEPRGRTLLVEMEMGYFGVRGRVRNVNSHELEHEHDVESATTNDVRFLAVAPEGSTGMLVFVERAGTTVAASHVLPMFHAAWRQHWEGDDLMLKIETLVESAAWLEKAELEQVSGVVNGYDWSNDLADAGKPKALGRLETTLVPDGKHEYLPKFVWKGLRDKNLDAAKILGLPEGSDVENVQVRVTADGKAKTFAIDREKQPGLSYLLSAKGMPDDEKFRAFCFDLAKDLLPGVGGEWKNALKHGDWPADQLEVKLELSDE